MAIPVISPTSSYLGFQRNEAFQFIPYASGNPFAWAISPVPGLSMDTPIARAVTGVASTDVFTSAAHGYEAGDRVYFPALTGGTGLTVNTIYFARDVSTDDFKVAATLGGAAINFSSDVSAGTVQKVSSGAISSTGIAVQGPIVFSVSATNADGTGTQEFVIGIGPGAKLSAAESDTAIDLAVDVPSGLVRLGRVMAAILTAEAQSASSLGFLKSGDVRIFAIRFFKDGTQIDPLLTALKMVFKEFATDPVIVSADNFEKLGSGATAVYRLAVSITRSDAAPPLSNHEGDRETAFDSLVELEWKSTITHNAAPLDLVGSSQIFPIRLSEDLAFNP